MPADFYTLLTIYNITEIKQPTHTHTIFNVVYNAFEISVRIHNQFQNEEQLVLDQRELYGPFPFGIDYEVVDCQRWHRIGSGKGYVDIR